MANRSRFDTHDVFNQSPPYENVDLYSSDAPLRDAGPHGLHDPRCLLRGQIAGKRALGCGGRLHPGRF